MECRSTPEHLLDTRMSYSEAEALPVCALVTHHLSVEQRLVLRHSQTMTYREESLFTSVS
jgi:hypothetical protein